MTDREKAIVMAHTGICMLTGYKFQIFHKYVEDIMGRPILTHEMGIASIADVIKAKSKDDFIALCTDESSSENPNKWIPVNERQPKAGEYVEGVAKYYLVQNKYGDMLVARYTHSGHWEQIYQLEPIEDEIVAWMPLPAPYKAERDE